jgi:ankyrin repeat protein
VLCRAKANVNATEPVKGRTALHLAVVNGVPVDVVVALLEGGVAANTTDEDGNCALHLAATVGQTPTIRALGKYADIEAVDVEVRTQRTTTTPSVPLITTICLLHRAALHFISAPLMGTWAPCKLWRRWAQI